MGQEQKNPLGEKLADAACKAAIPGQPEGEALAEIWSEGLQVKPRSGSTVFLPYTEMSRADSANFGIHVIYPTGAIFLSMLGAKYDQFYLRLTDAWGDALARAMLMSDDKVLYEARATYINVRPDGSQSFGPCRARIQPSGLVVLPVESPPVKLNFVRVPSLQAQGFRINVETSDRGVFELLRMGASYQFFAEKLIGAKRDFESESFQALSEFSPGIGFDRILEMARLMAEGRAVGRKVVQAKSFDFWLTLVRLVKESPLAAPFTHLQSLADDELTSIGFKKTLRGNYVWFMMAIPGSVEKGGNSVAMEVTSEGGHATYLFRVLPRAKFPGSSPEDFREAASETLRATNEAMITTGFRREPIYLDEAKLSTPAYRKYLYASRNLPELVLLRDRFYARIIHTTPESWTADLSEALLFNVSAVDDGAKWGKSQAEAESPPE